MKVKVINCDYIFIKQLIKHIKDNIEQYNQGFMVVDDTLYLPYYMVLRRKYNLPTQVKTTTIDLESVTKHDSLATYFYKVDALDIDDIIDLQLAWLDNDFDDIINATDYIAQAKYDLGYHDAFENL